jgi:hypothetical protein
MDETKTDTNESLTANYLYNIDFISFLNDNFIPSIFIWSGFIFRNLNFKGKNGETITHLTSGSIEKEFGTIKKQMVILVYIQLIMFKQELRAL